MFAPDRWCAPDRPVGWRARAAEAPQAHIGEARGRSRAKSIPAEIRGPPPCRLEMDRRLVKSTSAPACRSPAPGPDRTDLDEFRLCRAARRISAEAWGVTPKASANRLRLSERIADQRISAAASNRTALGLASSERATSANPVVPDFVSISPIAASRSTKSAAETDRMDRCRRRLLNCSRPMDQRLRSISQCRPIPRSIRIAREQAYRSVARLSDGRRRREQPSRRSGSVAG